MRTCSWAFSPPCFRLTRPSVWLKSNSSKLRTTSFNRVRK
ncbi:hypothetical protein [Enterobacter phage 03_vB_Eclo_IJM]|nr:hypothetical protein [Enterobacter phage 03_vB_Eclo_IJM]